MESHSSCDTNVCVEMWNKRQRRAWDASEVEGKEPPTPNVSFSKRKAHLASWGERFGYLQPDHLPAKMGHAGSNPAYREGSQGTPKGCVVSQE